MAKQSKLEFLKLSIQRQKQVIKNLEKSIDYCELHLPEIANDLKGSLTKSKKLLDLILNQVKKTK